LGKLSSKELQKILNCIKKDERVLISPMIGYDSGVHCLDGMYLVVSTDPCTGVPQEWFGYLMINYAASDLSLSGAKPQFCTINLLGPLATKPQVFQKIMRQACKAAEALGIAIVRGHTGMYDSLNDLVGVCTVYGNVKPERLITSGNAKSGDLILCTKPLGLETVINFSLTHPLLAQTLFGEKQQKNLSRKVPMESCVNEALKLAELGGVHAMHDVTEGGFVAAINELSEASKVGFTVNWEKIPFTKEALTLKDNFKLSDEQLLAMSSTGTILAAISPNVKQKVADTLQELGLSAAFIGEFAGTNKHLMVKGGKKVGFPKVACDPYTKILSAKT
jgi:hydrogenase expression/formation protein HypE